MVALTGEAAREAHAHARALRVQLSTAEALIGDALQAELAALRQVNSRARVRMYVCVGVALSSRAGMIVLWHGKLVKSH